VDLPTVVPLLSAVVIFMKNAYLEKLLETFGIFSILHVMVWVEL
jgi:hypothetical protein